MQNFKKNRNYGQGEGLSVSIVTQGQNLSNNNDKSIKDLEVSKIKQQNSEIQQSIVTMDKQRKTCLWKPKSVDYAWKPDNFFKKIKLQDKGRAKYFHSNSSNNCTHSNQNTPIDISFVKNQQFSFQKIPKINFFPKDISYSQVNQKQITSNIQYDQYFKYGNKKNKPWLQKRFKNSAMRKYSEQIGNINTKCFSKVQKESNYNLSYNSLEYENMIENGQKETKINQQFNNSWGSSNNLVSSQDIMSSKKISYWKLKIQNIGQKKDYNNQSMVKSQTFQQLIPENKLNQKNNILTNSFQFDDRSRNNPQKNQAKRQRHQILGLNNWKNTISSLFEQDSPVYHLTESIRQKQKQDQPFEKQYLKDVKLDMLQKFGRNINIIVQQTLQSKLLQDNLFMSLIQEQTQQNNLMIYQSKLKNQSVPNIQINKIAKVPSSIPKEEQVLLQPKQIPIKQCLFLQKEDEMQSQLNSQAVFNFQSQHYALNTFQPL